MEFPSQPTVSIQGLRKSFGTNAVLKGLDLEIGQGEFVGLMGPNGAGKSTVIKILDGVYEADSGTIEYRGVRVSSLKSITDVGFVHQDLGIVDDLTVLENLRLGLPPARWIGPILDRPRERRLAMEALSLVGLAVPLEELASRLSPGEKALLAVSRLLSTGARFLIVDEATSTLPPHDARVFIEALRALTADGATVDFVSHKLSEVRSACNRVVLLIDGEITADQELDAADETQLVRLLGGHERGVVERHGRGRTPVGDPVLELRKVRLGEIGPLNLSVSAGEVVGLTGLVGSGLHDVAYLAAGYRREKSGQVLFHGSRRALVAPQRETEGSILDLSVAENATLSALKRWRRRGLLSLAEERRAAVAEIEELNVVPRDPDITLGALSGGNQQKVLFGRVLLTGAELYVLCEPTRGVDIATRRELYRLIERLRDDACAVLVVTSDAEDLFAVCDRVGVLEEGEINGPWRHDQLNEDALALVL